MSIINRWKQWGHIKMVYRWADVGYEGFIFTVQGDWQDNCFQEYDIVIDDISILELLLPDVKSKIVDKAEIKLMEMDNE